MTDVYPFRSTRRCFSTDMSLFSALWNLRWRNQPYSHPLPTNLSRSFIPTDIPGKELELLVAGPSQTSPADDFNTPPILFLHGGFGSAAMYIECLDRMHRYYQSKHSTYALSLRGHGASYSLSYLSMVYGTSINDLASDVALAIKHITGIEGRSPIVLGHSSGGGLIQHCLATNKIEPKLSGLILLDAVPNYGMLSVYANWARHDPWFILRMFLHLGHNASPLSTPALVGGAFFSPRVEIEDRKQNGSMVKEFMTRMAPYESLLWPLHMMSGFWNWITTGKQRWLNPSDIIRGIDQSSRHAPRILIITGDKDVLMDIPGQQRMVDEYREAMAEIGGTGNEHGVRFVICKGGHHIQNNLNYTEVVDEIIRFAQGLAMSS